MTDKLKRKLVADVSQEISHLKKKVRARQAFWKDFDRRLNEIRKSFPDNKDQTSSEDNAQQLQCS